MWLRSLGQTELSERLLETMVHKQHRVVLVYIHWFLTSFIMLRKCLCFSLNLVGCVAFQNKFEKVGFGV